VHRPESQGFNVEFSDLDLTEENLVKAFRDQFESEFLKAKDLADKDPVLVPINVATIVDAPRHEAVRIDVLDYGAWKHRRAGLIQAARRLVVQSFVRGSCSSLVGELPYRPGRSSKSHPARMRETLPRQCGWLQNRTLDFLQSRSAAQAVLWDYRKTLISKYLLIK
jgi:hypothetical protein